MPTLPYGTNMRIMPLEALIRLFRSTVSEDPLEFQVIAHGQPPKAVGDEELESLSSQTLDILLDKASGVVLGPVTGCDFVGRSIELEFTVEARSVEELHRRVGHVLGVLEEHGPFLYRDSTTSRLDPDREAVPA